MNVNNFFSKSNSSILKIVFLSLGIFTFFRLLLFTNELFKHGVKITLFDTVTAFLMGIRFDFVMVSYFLILPSLILFILSFSKKGSPIIYSIIFWFINILFGLSFLICAADIPYFEYFYSRFSIVAFQWLESPKIMFEMIFEESQYWVSLIPFFILLFTFYKLSKLFYKPIFDNIEPKKLPNILISFLILAIFFFGIRGSSFTAIPIRVSTAFFCENSFLNQLGLNPNFTLISSYLESKREGNQTINLMDNELAIEMAKKNLGILNIDHLFFREISQDKTRKISKMNVILIIMESMSANKMGLHGNKNHLTPFLDSLASKSYYFKNTYSSGIHTYNGIYSTLFSYPALFSQHPLRDVSIKHKGLFLTLQKNKYSTIYFTTHDGLYDNIEGFLRGNACEKVITVKDYPEKEVKTAFGVPDDYMFRFSMSKLNKLHQKNKPFVATFMTTSDHGPYFIPKYFKPTAKDKSLQATQYADYSLKKMMQLAAKQKWYDNTLFVFVADHGAALDQDYDMPLSYNHIPLLFYSPKLINKPEIFSKMAMQIDVYPTIMGLLNIPYKNTTLGIDLLKENRKFSYFNGDNKYGVIDENWFLIVKEDKSKFLYKFQNKDIKDYANKYPEIVNKMNNYAKSNLQSYQYYLKNSVNLK